MEPAAVGSREVLYPTSLRRFGRDCRLPPDNSQRPPSVPPPPIVGTPCWTLCEIRGSRSSPAPFARLACGADANGREDKGGREAGGGAGQGATENHDRSRHVRGFGVGRLGVFAFLCAHIGRRKGVGLGAAILGSFPAWFVLFAFWLASHTDKDVLERMKRLEERR